MVARYLTLIAALLLASSAHADSFVFGCYHMMASNGADQICSWPTMAGGSHLGEVKGNVGAGIPMPMGSRIVGAQVCHGDENGWMQQTSPTSFAVAGKTGAGGDYLSEWLVGSGCAPKTTIPDAIMVPGDEIHIHAQSPIKHSVWVIIWYEPPAYHE